MPLQTPLRLLLLTAAWATSLAPQAARAEGKLEARYTISFAGIPIGKGQWSAEIGNDAYVMSAGGGASGLITALLDGEGTITARGAMRNGQLAPASFTSSIARDGEKNELQMTLDGGRVKDVVPASAPEEKDRVPVTDAHRAGILDPLSAIVIPAGAEGLAPQACQRTLPIFDGRRRFDLKLSFKRMDKVKADKGYAGPAVVCAVVFQPIAGHRASSALAKYLSEGREIEMWLAPIAGTRVLAPFRLSVASLIGNMVIAAHQFEASAEPSVAGAKAP